MNSPGAGPEAELSDIQEVVMKFANTNLTKALQAFQEIDHSGEQQLFAPR